MPAPGRPTLWRMTPEEIAAASTRRVDDLQTSAAEQQRAFFENSSHVAPIGNVIAGLVALSLLWSHIPSPSLWAWFAIVIVLAGVQAVAATRPEDAAGTLAASGSGVDTNVLAGIIWGLLPWLDIGGFGDDEVYRWMCLALAFGIGAGSMSGLSVLTGIAMRIQTPMYTLLATAFLVAGEPAVAAGVVAYLALITSDLRATGRHLRQLVAARVETAHLAADAETEARLDPLTGLLNRVGAFERVERLRGGGPFVMMFVDLDYFKEVNDRLGHGAGDQVLIETSRRIAHAMRPDDIVARLGGDEFLVVFSHEGEDLDPITARVLSAVERPVVIGDDEASVSASIGVTVVESDDWSTSELLREADHALYEAKRAGRQRIVWFDDRLAAELERQTALEGELRATVATSIDVVARPVVDLTTGEVRSVEITPRWSPRGGRALSQTRLREVAETAGLADALTRSVLEQAVGAAIAWRGHPVLGPARVTVRVIARQLSRGDLLDDVARLANAAGLRPGELELMLTETATLADPTRVAEVIASLDSIGVGLVLGEFGSGSSTLRDLLRLPIDVVSLHPSLARQAPADEMVAKLIGALAAVAASLDLRVAADGVDTEDQLAVVRRLGLPFAQGDAVYPPRPIEELAAVDLGVWPTST